MALPDEELLQLHPLASDLAFDRRGRDRAGPAASAPSSLAVDLAGEGMAFTRGPGAMEATSRRQAPGILDSDAGRLLVPLAQNAARALEPAFTAAVRAVSDRIHRGAASSEEVLRDGRLLEDAGDPLGAFDFLARSFVAAPFDAGPIRSLERLAGAHGFRPRLADLYERVLELNPTHPSAGTLQRRADQLRAGGPLTKPPLEIANISGPADSGDQPLASHSSELDQETGSPPDVPAVPLAPLHHPPAERAPSAPRRTHFARHQKTGPATSPSDPGLEIDRSLSARTVALGRSTQGSDRVPFPARLLGWSIDLGIVAAVPSITIWLGTRAFARPGLSHFDQLLHAATLHPSLLVAGALLVLLTAFVYLTLALAIGGCTIGDRIAGLRSVDIELGEPPDLPTAALRSAIAIAGTLFFFAGPLWALVDAQGQALHDKVAGTRTIRCAASHRAV